MKDEKTSAASPSAAARAEHPPRLPKMRDMFAKVVAERPGADLYAGAG